MSDRNDMIEGERLDAYEQARAKGPKRILRPSYGCRQMLLRRKFWMQDPHTVHLDISGAISFDYTSPTLTEIAATQVAVAKQILERKCQTQ